ncbi:BLUF domain-containing protein [Piscinibacter sp. HJYY11]|uniref:BLUF domain-containing protein n=1 Tax=Piscinibacter sp. HJYY11 TaxID=2801333 RepID=UPI00191F90A9|nr:BLUF domain-containing protein [Piscinibacter sp. HJYY11]MBL0730592.1 BLUF domain-containing protein [Piscinibacter sp. HJYY11]
MSDQHPLEAIVYVSASVQPMGDGRLEALLVEARRLNLESGVTGALIYSDGVFMQYFEGEPGPMAQTYERIRKSRQHSRLVELMNEPIGAREFPDWHMALAQPSQSELLAISTANWVVEGARSRARASARSQGSGGLTLLRDFWRRRGSTG